ncbi:MAG: QueG-associated DUF1730 domain-containing protein [Porticoccaceae bacterium]
MHSLFRVVHEPGTIDAHRLASDRASSSQVDVLHLSSRCLVWAGRYRIDRRSPLTTPNPATLAAALRTLATELGFTGLGIGGVDLAVAEKRLADWLARGFHGDMAWMARHRTKCSQPAELVPGTLRVISVRMDYWPAQAAAPWPVLENPSLGYVSRYALGRDYNKRVRQHLQSLPDRIGALWAELSDARCRFVMVKDRHWEWVETHLQ